MTAAQTAAHAAPLPNPMDLPMGTKLFAFGAMCLGFFMATLDIQIVASSLRDIGGGLSASQDELSWVQTAYLIAEIIVIPMTGWLTRVFSTRWVFAFSALGFTITSMLCGLAWDIDSMILFRGLQGALGAAMIPTVYTTAFVIFTPKQRLLASTTIGALSTLAPTIGPVIGGWITSVWSWHWLFYLNVLPGLVVALFVPRYVNFDRANLSLLKKGDYIGILLISGFLGCLEYVLEEGPRKNWLGDDVILICAWVSGICFFLFLVHAFTAKDPIIDLRALGVRNFGVNCVLSFIIGIGIFCSVYLTPVFFARVRGFDSLQTGLALLSVGVFQLLGLVAYTFLARFLNMRYLLMLGLALFGIGCFLYVPLTSDWGWEQFLLPQALRGFGQQLAIPPIVIMALGALPPARLRSASGLFNLMRNLGGAIGIAEASTMLNDRLNFHYEVLAEHVSVGYPVVNGFLQQQGARISEAAGDTLNAANAGLGLLHSLLMREALTLTFSDAFLAVALCFVVGLIAAFFTRPMGIVAPPPDAH